MVAHRLAGQGDCSPRTRGWTLAAREVPAVVALLPAHAGMDPEKALRTLGKSSAPRAGGDGPCPPRRRPPRPACPAHAGMDPHPGRGHRPEPAPRARGDGPEPILVVCPDCDRSPRTRGRPPRYRGPSSDRCPAPARAGMAPRPTTKWSRLVRLTPKRAGSQNPGRGAAGTWARSGNSRGCPPRVNARQVAKGPLEHGAGNGWVLVVHRALLADQQVVHGPRRRPVLPLHRFRDARIHPARRRDFLVRGKRAAIVLARRLPASSSGSWGRPGRRRPGLVRGRCRAAGSAGSSRRCGPPPCWQSR